MITINKTRNIQDLNSFVDFVQSEIPKIKTVLKFGDEDLRFELTENLTQQEDELLDFLVLDFIDSDLSLKVPKIYDMVNPEVKSKYFHDINYKTELKSGKTLVPFRTVSQGEVVRVDWYETIDQNQNPQNLILKVEINYTRDATGFATYRTTTRTWINKDGSENESVKITPKFYFVNPSDMIDEGYKRRKLLVQSIQIPTLTFMTEALMPLGYNQESVVLQGRKFMDDYEHDFNKFVDNSSTITNPADPNIGRKSIIVQIENNDPSGRNSEYNLWLDKAPPSLGGLKTIRQYLIEEFSI